MGIDHIGSTDGVSVARIDQPVQPAPESRRRVTRLLVCLLVPAALIVAVGLALLWPGDSERPVADPGYGPGAFFVVATVDTVTISSCSAGAEPGSAVPPSAGSADSCPGVTATLQAGAERGRQVVVDVPGTLDQTDIGHGDRILLVAVPLDGGVTAYAFVDFARELPIGLRAAVYVLVVVAVARMRGLRALVGLAFAGLVIAVFTVPALLDGEDALLVGLVSAAAIMFVVLIRHPWCLGSDDDRPARHAVRTGRHRGACDVGHERGAPHGADRRGRHHVALGRWERQPLRARPVRHHHRRSGRAQRRHHHAIVGGLGAARAVA